jgi:tetratricopeptide (TPR) repeat protein
MTRMFFSLAFSRFDRGLARFDRGLSSSEVDTIAHQLINPGADAETKEDGYNSIVYRSLYLAAPAGFQKAIQYANEFLSQNRPTRAAIYVNLASAYGQQYRCLKSQGAKDDELKKVHDAALNAVAKAIEIDPNSKLRLRELLHPTPGAEDNDLQVFESDKDLADIIDRD